MAVSLALAGLAAWLTIPAAVERRLIVSPSRERSWLPLLIVAGAITGTLLSEHVFVVASAFLICGCVTWFVARQKAHRETTGRLQSTEDFLGAMVGDLEAGNPLAEALHNAAEFVEDTASDRTRVLFRHLKNASDITSVQRILTEHASACPELARASQPWIVADQHGVSLADLMRHTQRHVERQLRHRHATTAALQGPRATSVILSALPSAGLLMGTAMGARPLSFLTTTTLGGALLFFGCALVCAGFVWSQLIIEGASR